MCSPLSKKEQVWELCIVAQWKYDKFVDPSLIEHIGDLQ